MVTHRKPDPDPIEDAQTREFFANNPGLRERINEEMALIDAGRLQGIPHEEVVRRLGLEDAAT
ncbi:MAG TPA: hypothetical protein VG015_05985 [Candidatus Dormibacteraeota bacterium]|jgi:hypothetical protein|nr:hypothetical protein [Candidatus Dormibacteraeota bacterium]